MIQRSATGYYYWQHHLDILFSHFGNYFGGISTTKENINTVVYPQRANKSEAWKA